MNSRDVILGTIENHLKDVAIFRQIAVVLEGMDVNEIDEFIQNEGARQIEIAEEMNAEDLLMLMLDTVLEGMKKVKKCLPGRPRRQTQQTTIIIARDRATVKRRRFDVLV